MESEIRPTGLTPPEGTKIIETFLFSPQAGHVRLPNHLARMQCTAQMLGYPFDMDQAMLGAAVHLFDRDHRCRLTLDVQGRFDFSAHPFAPVTGEWVLAVSDQRLDADDVWLGVKTTQRAIYDAQRADMPNGVDEVIYLNTHDEVCEGTITNIIIETKKGETLTPPLTSGLLPGVYRQFEIDQSGVKEQVLTMDDLRMARAIYVVNSLRGRIKARLAE